MGWQVRKGWERKENEEGGRKVANNIQGYDRHFKKLSGSQYGLFLE